MTTEEKEFCAWLRALDTSIPDDWTDEQYIDSLKEMFNAHNYEYDIQPDHIVIKLHDTICVDSYGNKTPIYEPYIKITVKMGVYFRRTKFTYSQYEKGYAHSHVSNNARESWAGGGCWGGNKIIQNNFQDTLENVLCFYPTFLSQESTNTRPFKRLADLGIADIYSERTEPYFCKLVDYLPFIKVKIKSLFGFQKLEVVFSDEEAVNLLLEQKGSTIYKIDGRFYSRLRNISTTDKIIDTDFVFKDERQQVTVIADTDIPPKIPCPLTKKYILQSLNELVNDPKFYSESQTNSDN